MGGWGKEGHHSNGGGEGVRSKTSFGDKRGTSFPLYGGVVKQSFRSAAYEGRRVEERVLEAKPLRAGGKKNNLKYKPSLQINENYDKNMIIDFGETATS